MTATEPSTQQHSLKTGIALDARVFPYSSMHLTVPLFLASSIASMLTMMPSIPTAWGPSSYIPSSLSSLEPIPTSWGPSSINIIHEEKKGYKS